jgi:hypothetical protein
MDVSKRMCLILDATAGFSPLQWAEATLSIRLILFRFSLRSFAPAHKKRGAAAPRSVSAVRLQVDAADQSPGAPACIRSGTGMDSAPSSSRSLRRTDQTIRAIGRLCLHHDGCHNKRNQVHHLDHRVEGRSGGVLERIADVSPTMRPCAARALAAVVAIFDVLLGVIPGAAGVGHEHGQQLAADDDARRGKPPSACSLSSRPTTMGASTAIKPERDQFGLAALVLISTAGCSPGFAGLPRLPGYAAGGGLRP